MNKYIYIFKAEILMMFHELKFYWVNTLFYTISNMLLFFGIFYTFSTGMIASGDITNLLFGLFVWRQGSNALSELTYIIQDEALMGTLEQVIMTRVSFPQLLTIRLWANFVFVSIKDFILFVLTAYIFGVFNDLLLLGYRWFFILFMVFIILIGFYGLSFILGGLALLYKRVGSVPAVLVNLFLFFTGATIAVSEFPPFFRIISYFLPATWGMSCFRKLLIDNIPVGEILKSQEFIIAVTYNLLFLIGGLMIFNLFLRIAKNSGRLGHY